MNQNLQFFLLYFLILLFSSNLLANQSERIPLDNLQNEETVIVDSIIIQINNALEGSRISTKVERYIFNLGNRFHFKTRLNTVNKHLLFLPGDIVSKTTLIESERNLRNQIFFADATIELESTNNKSVIIHVTVFDQWSTVPIVGLKRIGGKWTHRFGVGETNLLGTGQAMSISHYNDLTTEGTTFNYYNSSFTKNRLIIMFQYTDNKGDYFYSSIGKPLISKYDKNSFQVRYKISTSSHLYYYDGNLLNKDDGNLSVGATNLLLEFNDIIKKYLYLDINKSYGFDYKIDIRFYSEIFEMKHNSNNSNLFKNDYAIYVPDDLTIPIRDDVLFGMELQLYKKEYAQTNNLNNFKWTENLTRIKRISFTLGRNIPQLGAKNNNLFLKWNINYTNFIRDKHFVFANSNLHYYLTSSGKKENGAFDANFRYQYKFTSLTNGKIFTQWKNYIGMPLYQQLLLGESTGLYGYPNSYYSGDALLLINSELTMITNFEIMTVIPAIAIFTSSGNTFFDYNHIDLSKMHSSIGFGLRFGLSRSVGAIVSHINFSWPLDDAMEGPSISIFSKSSL